MLARPELPQAAKDLLAAADLLETKGHCKGVLQDADGRHCALGSVIAVTKHNYDRYAKVFDYLADAVPPTGNRYGAIVEWNNAPERTAQEVIDLFRATAYNLALTEV